MALDPNDFRKLTKEKGFDPLVDNISKRVESIIRTQTQTQTKEPQVKLTGAVLEATKRIEAASRKTSQDLSPIVDALSKVRDINTSTLEALAKNSEIIASVFESSGLDRAFLNQYSDTLQGVDSVMDKIVKNQGAAEDNVDALKDFVETQDDLSKEIAEHVKGKGAQVLDDKGFDFSSYGDSIEKTSGGKKGEFFKKLKDNYEEVSYSLASQVTNDMVRGITGPFGKILQDLTGIDFGRKVGEFFQSIPDKIGVLFKKKKTKRTPEENLQSTAEDVKTLSSTMKETLSWQKDEADRAAGKISIAKKSGGAGEGGGGFFESLFGGGGFVGILKKIGPMLLKAAGPLLFLGLMATDFFGKGGGLDFFKQGKIGQGILTTLLGRSLKDEKGMGVAIGIAKQGLKWGALGATIGGPIGALIGAGVGALAATIRTGIEKGWFKSAWTATSGFVVKIAKGVADWASGTFEKAVDGVSNFLKGDNLVGNTIENKKEAFQDVKKGWEAFISGDIFGGLGTMFKGIVNLIPGKAFFDSVIQGIKKTKLFQAIFQDFFPNLWKSIYDFFTNVRDWVTEKIGAILEAGGDFFENIWGVMTGQGWGIADTNDAVRDAASGKAATAVARGASVTDVRQQQIVTPSPQSAGGTPASNQSQQNVQNINEAVSMYNTTILTNVGGWQ